MIAAIVSIAALYFAREVLIPLALAVLLSFLLAPLAKGLEVWRLGLGQEQPDPAMGTLPANFRVLCLPAKDDADEITGAMLAQLLEQAGYAALSFSVTDSPVAVLQDFSTQTGDIVCICALPPFALMNARILSKRLRARFGDLNIVIGLWHFSDGGAKYRERLGNAFANTVVTTLKQALEHIHNLNDSNVLRECHPPGIMAAGKEP